MIPIPRSELERSLKTQFPEIAKIANSLISARAVCIENRPSMKTDLTSKVKLEKRLDE